MVRERLWTGAITWAAGQQNADRWLKPTGINTLAADTAAPTTNDECFMLDLSGATYAALGVYAKKTVHAEAMTFALREIHAWSAVDEQSLVPMSGAFPGSGHFSPYIHVLGAQALNTLVWPTNSGGIKDSQGANAEAGGYAQFYNVINAHPSIAPAAILRVSLHFDASATVLAGTNTWTYVVRLVAG